MQSKHSTLETHSRTTDTSASSNLSRRVSSKLADGDVRGALRILTSDDSFASPTSDVVELIREKHPAPPSDLRDLQPPAEDSVSLIATQADVLRAINSFPPSSSAGLDGIRPAHLRSLVARTVAEAGARLLTALTALTNLAISGKIPDFAVQAFYGASLIALRKKGGGLRPIAIGNVFRRIAAKIAVSNVSAAIGAELRPAQLGVATRNGCEAAVHAVRAYITDAASSSQPTVIVKLDVSNAFNSVRRDIMLETARTRLPSIYPLVWQAYSGASPLYIGDSKIWSRTGIQQGDPLSSLLFSLPSTGYRRKPARTSTYGTSMTEPLEDLSSRSPVTSCASKTSWRRGDFRSTARNARQSCSELVTSHLCVLVH